jgi:RNA polymerase sigma-70 factor (ECF subfamily)
VLGNLGLRKLKDFLKMADAQRPVGQQVNNSKPCRITKALVNLNQIHPSKMSGCEIFVNSYIWFDLYFRRRIFPPDMRKSELLNGRVIGRLRTAIRGFVGSRIRDPASADDITQNVLLKISTHLDSLANSERIEAWAFRIARNSVADHFRAAKPTEEFQEELHREMNAASDSETVISDEEARLRSEIADYIRSVVEALPPIYREALLLTEYDGLSQVELAERLGLSVSAAKSRVQRARAMMKKQMEHCCYWTTDRYGTVIDVRPRTSAIRACDACENS